MDLLERMESGKLFYAGDPELSRAKLRCKELLYDFNHARPSQAGEMLALLGQLLGAVGEGCWIEPPLYVNWGSRIALGDHVYANTGLTVIDDTFVTIGSHVMLGPRVTISAASHPVDPELRRQAYQYDLPVVLEENVWVGAGATILPGVTIGKNSVIGAGSVVDRDIPPGRGGRGGALPGAPGDRPPGPGVLPQRLARKGRAGVKENQTKGERAQ